MKHICIYTTRKVLEHKQRDGKVYWRLPNTPKLLDKWYTLKYDVRIYFAIKGFIVGYFIIDLLDFDKDGNLEILFDDYTWEDIKPILQPAFQGFKYIEEK